MFNNIVVHVEQTPGAVVRPRSWIEKHFDRICVLHHFLLGIKAQWVLVAV